MTVASRGKDIVVQGWKKRITRLRTPVLNSFHPYILIGKAEDKNLWLLRGDSTNSYLYDFGRDELITVPFDNNKQQLVRTLWEPASDAGEVRNLVWRCGMRLDRPCAKSRFQINWHHFCQIEAPQPT